MRWLLRKDLLILRRSPVLLATLVAYPVVIALLVGFTISSPAGKPKVAIYTGSNISRYATELYSSIDAVRAPTPAAAIADVRDGRTLAAVLIPRGIGQQMLDLVQSGSGAPTIRVVLNSRNPLERSLAEQAIQSRVDAVERVLAKDVIAVAIDDLQRVLRGGSIDLVNRPTRLLGLEASRAILAHAIRSLPPGSRLSPPIARVVHFAEIAIAGLTFATPVLDNVGSPLRVRQTQLAGRTTPSSSYAAAIAIVFLTMFVAVLLAAGMLALERSENVYRRLARGLVRPAGLLAEKVVLAAACAAVEALVIAAAVSIVTPLDWSQVGIWIVAFVLGGVAFAALGAAVGGLARDVSVASLLAFLISLPIAFAALVPSTAVSAGLGGVLDVISFAFPFRAALQVLSDGFSGTGGGVALAALHLVVLAGVFAGLARAALARFATG